MYIHQDDSHSNISYTQLCLYVCLNYSPIFFSIKCNYSDDRCPWILPPLWHQSKKPFLYLPNFFFQASKVRSCFCELSEYICPINCNRKVGRFVIWCWAQDFIEYIFWDIIQDIKVHGAHLGPLAPRWALCWPHEPCYQRYYLCCNYYRYFSLVLIMLNHK